LYGESNTSAAPAKFIIYGLNKIPDAASQLAPHERRALHHFQGRTKDHIQGPFRSIFWSNVVPSLVENDAIVREAVVALSNMHEYYLDGRSELCLNSALQHYQKTLRQIVKLESPDQSFDSVLTSCIILHSFESLRGAFDEATRHASAGVKMIVERKRDSPPDDTSTIFSKQVVSELLLELQQQIMEANEIDYIAQYPDLIAAVSDLPEGFNTVEEALPYFHLITYQCISLFEKAELYHNKHPFVAGFVAPPLQDDYQALLATFDAWSRSLSNIESVVHSRGRQQYEGYLVLKIFQLSVQIDIEVFVRGESAYDAFSSNNFGILKLIEVLLQIQPDHGLKADEPISTTSRPPVTFVSSLGIVSLLFEIATRTDDDRLREETLKVLRLTNRREGIWDSRVAIRLAERILEMQRDGSLATEGLAGQKFLITDIQLLSDEKVKVTYGFKSIFVGSFQSFWLEDIKPGEGTLHTEVVDIGPG
jgi:hypothetical protein